MNEQIDSWEIAASNASSGASTLALLDEARDLVDAGHPAKVWVFRNRERWRYHCWVGSVHFHNGTIPIYGDASEAEALESARALLPGGRVAILRGVDVR